MIPRDQHNEAARAAFRSFNSASEVLLPFATLLELHRLIVHRKPADPAFALGVIHKVRQAYPVVVPTAGDLDSGLELLHRYSDQAITLADAVLASMAKNAGAQVLTFDHRHFGLMGAEVYG
jgi:predicted nucleic acid-binding protein